MLQNFGTALSREQMKMVMGGQDPYSIEGGTCTANCPSSQSASCTGFTSCVYDTGTNGYDKGVSCTVNGTTIYQACTTV